MTYFFTVGGLFVTGDGLICTDTEDGAAMVLEALEACFPGADVAVEVDPDDPGTTSDGGAADLCRLTPEQFEAVADCGAW